MISENVSLKPFNTFGIDVKATRFATFSSTEELGQILKGNKKQSLLILGGGSNLLLTKDFDGLVLKNEINGIEVISETENDVLVKVGAGEVWHDFVLYCISKNYCGIENLSLIPGSVGASPMQNIGAYGVEIKNVFDHLDAYEITTGEIHTFDNATCEFGYRESIFKHSVKNQYVITNVYFKLSKTQNTNTSYGAINQQLEIMGIENPTIKDVSDAVIEIRSSKLPNPKVLGNAGSFFKNPEISKERYEALKALFPSMPGYNTEPNTVKVPAGWLIETAGWKGKVVGETGVHKNQALVLVNYGGATGDAIYKLSTDIIEDVEGKFKIQLSREVNIL